MAVTRSDGPTTKTKSTAQVQKRLSFCTTVGNSLSANYNPDVPQLPGNIIGKYFFVPGGLNYIAWEMSKLAEKSGVAEFHSGVRIGSRMFFISDPKLIKQLYTDERARRERDLETTAKEAKTCKGLIWPSNKTACLESNDATGVQGRAFGPRTTVALPDGPLHDASRKAFLHNVLNKASKYFPNIHETYAHYFGKVAGTQIQDLRQFSECFALTIMANTILGIGVTDIPEADKIKIAKCTHDLATDFATPSIYRFMDTPVLNRCIAAKLNSDEKEADRLIRDLVRKNEKTIFERLKKFNAEMEKELPSFKINSPKDLYTDDIIGEIKLILAGGFETTSKLLLNLLMIFGSNNENYKKHVATLREEIANYMRKQNKPVHEWDQTDFDQLPFLKAFIMETLRLFPPFSYLKQTAAKSFTHGKHYIPKGTNIFISAYDAARIDPVYGDDAAEFNPARWLQNEKLQKYFIETAPQIMHTFGNLRACPGRKLPFNEALVILAQLAANFIFNINETDTVKPSEKIETVLQPGFTLELKPGVTVSAKVSEYKQELVAEEKAAFSADSAPADEKSTSASGLGLHRRGISS